jgi:glycine C-acetyltransferase
MTGDQTNMDWNTAISVKSAQSTGGTSQPPVELRLTASQGPEVGTYAGAMINMSSNNYLSLADHEQVRKASIEAVREFGFGLASVRFLSGTHAVHKRLEDQTAALLAMEEAVLFGSCFDANADVFEALLDAGDRIISDELNHASIIDGIRLCKAKRLRYKNADMEDLRRHLETPHPGGMTLIVTDGVFSMNGTIAPLRDIVSLARKHGAFVMVDDSHGLGAVGKTGRGTAEEYDLLGQVDLITGTYGKALGGGMGGFAATSSVAAAILRRRARPYLFSNPIPPQLAAGASTAIEIMLGEPERVSLLKQRATYLRAALRERHIEILPGDHPIVPVMLRDTQLAQSLVAHCRAKGVLVSAIVYPIVPKGEERVRLQVSSGHTIEQLDRVANTVEAWWQEAGFGSGSAA